MLCSFCGKACSDHACNTLEDIANEHGTDHDSVCTIIWEHDKKLGVNYRSLVQIPPQEWSEILEEAKERFPHGVHNNINW